MKRLVLNFAGLFVAIVAVLFGVQSLYLMAAILWLIPAVSSLMGWLMLGGLDCERLAPSSAAAGEVVTLTYRLQNTGRLPKFYLLMRDTLPRGMQRVGPSPPLVLSLWPGEEGETRGAVQAVRRGVFPLGPAQVLSTDPLGLQTFTQKLPLVSELVVYPAVLPIRESWLRGAAAQGWRGTASALTRGDGDDFYGVREYGPGDELRRVHWRTTARTGVLAVTEYARGVTLDVTVALDLSRVAYAETGAGQNGALEAGVTLAATLLDDLVRHGHTVRLLSAASSGADMAAIVSPDDLPRLMDALARVQADSPRTLAEVLDEDRGAGTLVMISPAAPAGLAARGEEWEARGGQWFGFLLDAESFRGGTAQGGWRESAGDRSNVRVVRQGDDLRTILERQSDVWSG